MIPKIFRDNKLNCNILRINEWEIHLIELTKYDVDNFPFYLDFTDIDLETDIPSLYDILRWEFHSQQQGLSKVFFKGRQVIPLDLTDTRGHTLKGSEKVSYNKIPVMLSELSKNYNLMEKKECGYL